MYVGVDHGTSAIRVGLLDGGEEDAFSLERREGVAEEFFDRLEPFDVELVAVTYSMGDALLSVKSIGEVEGRGIVSREGAGERVGAGTELFDAVRASNLPAVVLPGIHRRSPPVRPPFGVYSHCGSSEKVAAAYRALETFGGDLCLSDVGSNTVTVGVVDGEVVGGIDAPIFAPGLDQGPIDVEGIRRVDSGDSTANEEFGRGGTGDVESLADLVAMEMRAVNLVVDGSYVLTGRAAGDVYGLVEERLGSDVELMDARAAALGGAQIARDVDRGAESVLGFPVEL